MSGWGGAVEKPENQEAARRLSEKCNLDATQFTIVGDILHTMTHNRKYSTAEVELMISILLSRN